MRFKSFQSTSAKEFVSIILVEPPDRKLSAKKNSRGSLWCFLLDVSPFQSFFSFSMFSPLPNSRRSPMSTNWLRSSHKQFTHYLVGLKWFRLSYFIEIGEHLERRSFCPNSKASEIKVRFATCLNLQMHPASDASSFPPFTETSLNIGSLDSKSQFPKNGKPKFGNWLTVKALSWKRFQENPFHHELLFSSVS